MTRNVEPGETVQPGTVAFTIGQLDEIALIGMQIDQVGGNVLLIRRDPWSAAVADPIGPGDVAPPTRLVQSGFRRVDYIII